jgi:hypothetical protein
LAKLARARKNELEAGMKRKSLLLVAGVIGAVYAQAQTQPSSPPQAPADWQSALKSVTEACKGEMPQLCPDLSATTAMACLQTNIDKLTPACKDAVTKMAKSALP